MTPRDRIRKAIRLCNVYADKELGKQKKYCRHAWQKTDPRPMRELVATETTIEFECGKCGKTKKHTLVRRDDPFSF